MTTSAIAIHELRRLATELSERIGAVVIALGIEEEQVVRFVLLERVASSTSTSPFRSTTARCRPAT